LDLPDDLPALEFTGPDGITTLNFDVPTIYGTPDPGLEIPLEPIPKGRSGDSSSEASGAESVQGTEQSRSEYGDSGTPSPDVNLPQEPISEDTEPILPELVPLPRGNEATREAGDIGRDPLGEGNEPSQPLDWPHGIRYDEIEIEIPPEESKRSTFVGELLLGLVHPRFYDHILRRPSEFAGLGRDPYLHMHRRLEWQANRSLNFLTFRISQLAEVLTGFVGISGEAAIAARLFSNPRFQRFTLRALRATRTGKSRPTYVDLGAGEDLGASTHWAKKGANVVAVEPREIKQGVLEKLKRYGGKVIQGRSRQVAAKSADHVIINFPYRITGSGRVAGGLTHEAVSEGLRIAKPGGVVTLVTEHKETAVSFLNQVNTLRQLGAENVEVLSIKAPARIAAPGSSGFGVPDFSSDLSVHLINVYIPRAE
jgi:hypothetical protein